MVLMNTVSARVQAWSGLVLSTIIALTAISAFLTHPSPKALRTINDAAQLNITSVQPVYGRSTWHLDRAVQEYLEVQWSYAGDFAARTAASKPHSLWTWNTKQIYISLVVEWDSPLTSSATGKGRVKNEAVVWDRIIRRKQDARLAFEEMGNKYGVRELTKKWGHIPSARFTLKWNVMPKVGLLSYGNEATTGQVAIPQRVISQEEAEYTGRTKYRGERLPY